MVDFKIVPVLDIHQENFTQVWPSIQSAISNATFVALDLELSGLGPKKGLMAREMDDRFKAIVEIAHTRSIISFGLSCFQRLPSPGVVFQAQTFNLLLLCSEEYVVDPTSLRFLVGHGFDFNKQYSKGLPYHRGNDNDQDNTGEASVRSIMVQLVTSAVPVIFHNALVDLVFLHHNLYAEVPTAMATFLADTSEIYSGGIYDTKYITEFRARMPASFLQYVFRKCQRDNSVKKSGVQMKFINYPASVPFVNRLLCGLTEKLPDSSNNSPCLHYASHGWCTLDRNCPNSHDIDIILDNEPLASLSKRKRRNRRKMNKEGAGENNGEVEETSILNSSPAAKKDKTSPMEEGHDGTTEEIDKMLAAQKRLIDGLNGSEKNDGLPTEQMDIAEAVAGTGPAHSSTNGETCPSLTDSEATVLKADPLAGTGGRAEGHRAGFDAFMTGFIYACYVNQYGSDLDNKFALEEYVNKICLTGKDHALQIQHSIFSKSSAEHKLKIQRLRGQQNNEVR